MEVLYELLFLLPVDKPLRDDEPPLLLEELEELGADELLLLIELLDVPALCELLDDELL